MCNYMQCKQHQSPQLHHRSVTDKSPTYATCRRFLNVLVLVLVLVAPTVSRCIAYNVLHIMCSTSVYGLCTCCVLYRLYPGKVKVSEPMERQSWTFTVVIAVNCTSGRQNPTLLQAHTRSHFADENGTGEQRYTTAVCTNQRLCTLHVLSSPYAVAL